MRTSGMARKVDDLGRIVLPVEMRRLFGIQAGDALEIAVEDSAIVLRKMETSCVFCGATDVLRSYRAKQLCTSCASELQLPAVDVSGSEAGRVRALGGVREAELSEQPPSVPALSTGAQLDEALAPDSGASYVPPPSPA